MAKGRQLEINVESRLYDRMKSVCDYLHISGEDLLGYALEQEIVRQEVHMVKDEITLQEINKNVLGKGQSLMMQLGVENQELFRQSTTCQMCLKEIAPEEKPEGIEGPLFCHECLDLARGGDFTKLESSP